jgi:hypothetical protein
MISPGFSLDTAAKVGASPRTVQRNVCKTAIWPKCILSSHLRRKEIYEARYPETRRGGDRKSEEAISNGNDFRLISFADDASSKLGVTDRTIRQEVQIASNIVERGHRITPGLKLGPFGASKAQGRQSSTLRPSTWLKTARMRPPPVRKTSFWRKSRDREGGQTKQIARPATRGGGGFCTQ